MKKETIYVDGMTCNHCKAAVEGALKNLAGVVAAEVDLSNKNVLVQYEESKVTVEQLKEEIDDQGYDVKA
ncbi:copper chaperone CopZ [Alteribacter aurantiacus]|uniref:copper chaperone CopZ n=1 Tax=Alteribacter aurantiacus TaxID=254410 RepID=UPI0004231C79|nr:copper chaperone CopZ [Alteribacter aurantiacus]